MVWRWKGGDIKPIWTKSRYASDTKIRSAKKAVTTWKGKRQMVGLGCCSALRENVFFKVPQHHWHWITSWNPKQPFIDGCLVKQPFSIYRFGIIQLKQPFIKGCLGFRVGMVRRFQPFQRSSSWAVQRWSPEKHSWVRVGGGTRCGTQGFLSSRRIRDTLWGRQWDDRWRDEKSCEGKSPNIYVSMRENDKKDARHSSKQFDLRQL